MIAYNPFSLREKKVLITGASSGIGQETAIQCSRLGAKVIITGRNLERLKETMSQMEGDEHQMIIAELTQQTELEKLVDAVDSLNGLVLSAGKGFTSPFTFASKEKVEDVFNVNFCAPLELMRLLVKKKKIMKDSSIVLVSSIGGVVSFLPGNSIYGASKAALNSMMRYCAKELAPKKIRVNSVNPGMVNTKLIQGGALSEEQYRLDMERYPLKRYGETPDIAYGIIYLLSDAASWVTGHSLVIDGGVTI